MGKGSIILVDDQPDNVALLEQMLGRQGYEVRSFVRGADALAAAAEDPPDLVLTDISMPEMDGYEVCSRLKADEELKSIPVVFLSALGETGDKMKAFRSGGIDYITKPFRFEEVRARVDTHCRLHRLQQELRAHNEHLEELVAARTRELGEAHAQLKILDRAKSDFLKLISHEFRTPLNGLLGVADLLLDESAPDDELREVFEHSRRRILTMLEDASVLTEIEVSEREWGCAALDLDGVLTSAIDGAEVFARSRDVAIDKPALTGVQVHGDQKLLGTALRSLLETAVRFSIAGATVRVVAHTRGDIVVESNGHAVPPHLLPKFFDLFATGEAIAPEGDFGLGPALAYRILSLCGGTVAVNNREEERGIRLVVRLRRAAVYSH